MSHILDPLMTAQWRIYRDSPEIERDKLYKITSPSYIKSGKEYYFGRIDFQDGMHHSELCLNQSKKDFAQKHRDLLSNDDDKDEIWQKMKADARYAGFDNIFDSEHKDILQNVFEKNCILYFPANRFEEPAWLNQESLLHKPEYGSRTNLAGYTDRKIINYFPLRDNQTWLFDLIYDAKVFEVAYQFEGHVVLPKYSGIATSLLKMVINVMGQIFQTGKKDVLRFDTGPRQRRKISLVLNEETIIPSLFHCSSGETCLLNLFLSILRDFDLSRGEPFEQVSDIRGIVIVDEIDTHLHAVHQHEVLPELIKMFPRVQFIVTTHSPLFVLGMENTFGQDGFALYRLPQGQQISPEEFSEFGEAYKFFMETKKFSEDIKQKIRETQKSVVFMEGETDIRYLQRASVLLGREEMFEKIQPMDGKGFGNLDKIWKNFHLGLVDKLLPQKVILLYDCDKKRCDQKGNIFKRSIHKKDVHPLQKGIENLFDKRTLEKALQSNPAFIDVNEKHKKIERGQEIIIHERWEINENEKTNLCNWLCENGEKEDFEHFKDTFDLLEGLLRS